MGVVVEQGKSGFTVLDGRGRAVLRDATQPEAYERARALADGGTVHLVEPDGYRTDITRDLVKIRAPRLRPVRGRSSPAKG